MDNSYGNAYYSYNVAPQGMQKKFDAKGLIMTIACLVTSIMVALSTLMPIITFGTEEASESFNVIKVFEIIVEFVEWTSSPWASNISVETGILVVIAVIIFLIPVALMLIGIIATIVYIIKLVSGRYVKDASSFAWVIIIFEMIISTFMYIYVLAVVEILRVDDDYAENIGLSVGWYLPVIMCLVLLFMTFGMELARKIKGDTSKRLLDRVFCVIATVFTSILYFSFACSHYKITQRNEEIDLPYSYLGMSMVDNWDIYLIIINIFLVALAILVHICLVKNMRKMINGKFSTALNMTVGSLAIVFTIVNYILFDVYIGDRYNKYVTASMGIAGYMYIIMGSFLLITGIAYVCVKGFWNNRQNVATNPHYYVQNQQAIQYSEQQVQNGSSYNSQQMQNVNYYNQQQMQNANYYNQQQMQNVNYYNQQQMQNANYYNQQQMQNVDYYNQQQNM